MEADMTLQLREQCLDLLPLSLCMLELRCHPEISRSLPSCFVHVDGKIPERSGRALRSLLARTALFAGSDIAEGAVALVAAAIVQLLACWADVAVALRQVGKALRTVEGAPGSPDSIPGGHVRCDSLVHQPLQKPTIAIACIGSDGLWFPALPLGEASDHVLCGSRLLTQPSACRLHAHHDTTVVINQVVVVVPHACRRATLGRISGVRIGGGHLVLAMCRLLYWILSFQISKILAHRSIDLRGFGQLLSRDAALLGSVGLDESSIH